MAPPSRHLMTKSAGQILRQRLREAFRSKDRHTRRSQAALAKLLDLSQSQLSRRMTRDQDADFRLAELDTIAAFLKIPVPMLFVDPNDPYFPFERRYNTTDRRKSRVPERDPVDNWPADDRRNRLHLGASSV